MEAQVLLDKYFETAFSAPDGVKKLRELILSLAMQGKLVPQDPSDQPASELLKEIEAEKERLVKKEGLKTSAQTYINQDEKYIETPKSWEYCRLGNLAKFIDYRGKTPMKVDSGIPLITAKNIRFGFINREPYEYITEEEYKKWMTRGFPKIGDLLFTTEAPLGNVAIIDIKERFALAQRVICLQLHKPDIATFVKLLMMSNIFQEQLSNNATGMTAKGIKASRLKEIPILLPPLAEQYRIVEKIDRLMEQCDRLEKLRKEHHQKRLIIHTAARDRLLNATDQKSLNQSWNFIQNNFGELYSVKENVSELRKIILQLAVMGKLVPQDPNDPPASELLNLIENQAKKLIDKKQLKKGQITKDSKNIHTNINIPLSWMWVKGIDLFFITKLAGFEYTEYIKLLDHGAIPVIRAQNVRPFRLDTQNLKYIDLKTSSLLDRCALVKKSLLITFIGAGIGDVALFNFKERWHLAPNVAKIEPFTNCEDLINLNYFLYFLNSPIGKNEIFKHLKSTAQPSISMGTIRDINYPVPPLPEQCRIVEKVDQLMKMCDQVEQQIEQSTDKRSKLLNAILSNIQ
ncbi:MAG: restriction endonuclease subunit S [Snowella sp.]|nr:restriction endonuclease subunit S [Snowella sp.]